MRLVPVIIDCQVQSASDNSSADSLLLAPAGTGSVLDYLSCLLRQVTTEKLVVAPDFPMSSGYQSDLAEATGQACEVVPLSRLSRWALELEAEDFLLIVESRRWPLAGISFHPVSRHFHEYRGATHVVAVGSDAGRIREQVSSDENGHVRRVERLFNQISWPETADTSVVCSVLPAKLIANTGFGSLGELRSVLAVKGTLSRDVPLHSDLIDPSQEHGFLALHEQLLLSAMGQERPPMYREHSAGVWVGRDCRIENDVRLVPPIILQRDVQLERGATIVGPTLVGTGARVCSGAQIAQAVLYKGTVVGPGVSVCHRTVSGTCNESLAGQAELPDPSEPVGDPGWCDWHADNNAQIECLPWHAQMAIKRLLDIVLSGITIVLLFPFMLLVALLIKLDSRGPVFFRHNREGKGGKEFACIKFRTMIPYAHTMQRELYKQNEVDGPQFMLQKDPRLTWLGRFLRATNIDESPQLFNVFVGHMSLVGPRPSPFRENQICVPWRRARLAVRPGITGLWQLCRSSDRTVGDFHEWIFYDMAYVRHFSLWLDLKLLVMTMVTLGGRRRVPLSRFIRESESAGSAHEDIVTVGIKS